MTTTPVPPIDVDLLRSEIRKTYAAVSQESERDFIFPTGRAWAEDLGYPDELANIPDSAVESFAGVANPWKLGRLEPGERVLDVGSGAGTDSLVAAQMVGPTGSVTGIDMTPEMLEKSRTAAVQMGLDVTFLEADAERLPFEDASFDVVISNGVIDLIPDKDAVFSEIFRVLVPGGRIQVADITIQKPVSEEASATSTSGLAESQALSWTESTQRFWSGTASSASSTETSLPPTCARRSRTRAKRR